jgi:hypothetical protein
MSLEAQCSARMRMSPGRLGSLEEMMRRITRALAASALAACVFAAPAAAIDTSTLVSVGSPETPFSQNKQNEPALAVDQFNPSILAQGANDNIDLEACNAADDTTCPFTPGVGGSGLSFSLDGGSGWMQPTYSGFSARTCLGVVGSSDPGCMPRTPDQGGLIGTLPWYYENRVVSDGDPALAFGPAPDANGDFSWGNGSRLYYANLTSNFAAKRTDFAIKGVEGIGVSRTDDATAAANGNKAAWMAPVVIPSTSGAAFADKEQVWADNASSSPQFGNAYVCFANYRGGPSAGSAAHDLLVATSRDGGDSWSRVQVAAIPGSASGQFGVLSGASGCTIRTASDGTVYVFWLGWNQRLQQNGIYMATSTDGGATFSAPRRVFQVFHTGVFNPVQGRFEMDGITGARDDLSDAPSIDIANGAPTGAGATDQIVLTWVDGGDGLNNEHVLFTTSTDGGVHWAEPIRVESAGDRGFYSAAAISPNGQDVYLVYNAFLAPYQTDTTSPRPLVGVVKHADVAPNGSVGAFAELNRGASGDARGASANALTDEFLGDYVYAVATNDYGAAVWNDVRRADDCPAVDAWRMSLVGGPSAPQPAPEQDCPDGFGNTDIFGGSWPDPTP